MKVAKVSAGKNSTGDGREVERLLAGQGGDQTTRLPWDSGVGDVGDL